MQAPPARRITSIFVLFVLFIAVGCDDTDVVEPEGPSIDDVQEQVFNESCAFAGCHAGEDPAGDLDLSAGVAFDNIVNVASTQVPNLMRVEPENADDSYLYIKITSGDRIASGTFSMPIGGELTDEQIELVEEWIDSGAER